MSSKERIKELVSKYGKLGIYTHITLSLLFYGGFYFMVSRGFDWKKYLNKMGIDTSSSKWSTNAGNAAAAYVIYKTTMPARIGITVGVVPIVARILKR
jgi:hypothetical protein